MSQKSEIFRRIFIINQYRRNVDMIFGHKRDEIKGRAEDYIKRSCMICTPQQMQFR
jgi:hypothetical protein